MKSNNLKTDSNSDQNSNNSEKNLSTRIGDKPNSTENPESKYTWCDVCTILKNSPPIQQIVLRNINNLFISKQRFSQLKMKDKILENLPQKKLSLILKIPILNTIFKIAIY